MSRPQALPGSGTRSPCAAPSSRCSRWTPGDLSAARVTAGRRERDARAAAGAVSPRSDAKGAEPACAARWVSARAAAGTRARERARARGRADRRDGTQGREGEDAMCRGP